VAVAATAEGINHKRQQQWQAAMALQKLKLQQLKLQQQTITTMNNNNRK